MKKLMERVFVHSLFSVLKADVYCRRKHEHDVISQKFTYVTYLIEMSHMSEISEYEYYT